MHGTLRAAAAAGALALVSLGASDTCAAEEVVAYAEERPDLDYEAFFAALPRIRELAGEALALSRELNDTMEKLRKAEGDKVAAGIARSAARDLLVKYRDNRVTLLALVNGILKKAPAAEADLAILRRLRDTELLGVSWDKTKFIDCLRDIARAVGVRFVLHPDVLKFNTVEAAFPRASADGILRAITAGFGCDCIVFEGEIVVIKSLKRNDARIQKYLDRHPEWQYWKPEEVKEEEDDI
jgi:hypothetical protein